MFEVAVEVDDVGVVDDTVETLSKDIRLGSVHWRTFQSNGLVISRNLKNINE